MWRVSGKPATSPVRVKSAQSPQNGEFGDIRVEDAAIARGIGQNVCLAWACQVGVGVVFRERERITPQGELDEGERTELERLRVEALNCGWITSSWEKPQPTSPRRTHRGLFRVDAGSGIGGHPKRKPRSCVVRVFPNFGSGRLSFMDRLFPENAPDLAATAALLANQTRVMICVALLDGRAWTAREMAVYCEVPKSTMSEQLTVLIDGGLVVEVRQGKNRYVRLASDEVGAVLEQLGTLSTARLPGRQSLRSVSREKALVAGRTCYHHLAGRLGVGLADAFRDADWIGADWNPTPRGRDGLTAWGVTVDRQALRRRPLARPCLDWTERRPHLAGLLGDAICRRFLEAGWVSRVGDSRAVRLTPVGVEQVTQAGFSAAALTVETA